MSLLSSIESACFTALRRLLSARARDITSETGSRSCIIIAPHPDDEVLGAGGTAALKVAAGSEVTIVIVTDGRQSHKSTKLASEALVAMREQESVDGAARLGVSKDRLLHLRVPDGETDNNRDVIRSALLAILRDRSPAEIISPSPIDRHADHRTLGVLVGEMLATDEITVPVLEYPVWFWSFGAWRPRSGGAGPVWSMVRIARALLSKPVVSVDVRAHLTRKRRALAEHRTQMESITGEPDWGVLDERFLAHFFDGRELFFPLSKEKATLRARRGFA
ncbi:MAG: PIG-L family deacetylase [Phycisphaerales bacterium]|nr:MAG: PIG-L family deacetylase [Phycisphaerales bacterium]